MSGDVISVIEPKSENPKPSKGLREKSTADQGIAKAVDRSQTPMMMQRMYQAR